MGVIRDEQQRLVDELHQAGLERVTADPQRAQNQRPVVLIGPPALDYVARTCTHRLVVLAGHPSGTGAALEQLDELLTELAELLPLESADATSYALNPAADPLPAYLARYVTTL